MIFAVFYVWSLIALTLCYKTPVFYSWLTLTPWCVYHYHCVKYYCNAFTSLIIIIIIITITVIVIVIFSSSSITTQIMLLWQVNDKNWCWRQFTSWCLVSRQLAPAAQVPEDVHDSSSKSNRERNTQTAKKAGRQTDRWTGRHRQSTLSSSLRLLLLVSAGVCESSDERLWLRSTRSNLRSGDANGRCWNTSIRQHSN